MVCQHKTLKCYCFARLLSFFFVFCVPFPIFCLFAGSWQLKPVIIETGEDFSLIFRFTGDIRSSLHIKEPSLPVDLKRMSGPLISFDKNDNQTRVEFVYRSDRVGFVNLDPFIFTLDRRQEWVSTPIHVGVGEDSIAKENNTFPFSLELKIAKNEFLVGESVGLALFAIGNHRINEKDLHTLHFTLPACWQSFLMPLYFEVQTLRTPQGQILKRPLLNWLINSPEEGNFIVPAFSLTRDGKTYFSQELKVIVRKPKEMVDQQGVGVFELVLNLSAQELSCGDTLKFTMALTGEGNFSELTFPLLSIEKAKIISVKEENTLHVCERGLKGSLFRTYVLAPESSEDIKICVPGWTYWNVEQNKILSLPSSQYIVKVNGKNSKPVLGLKDQEDSLLLLTKDQMHERKFSFLFANPLSYLLLLPGTLIFVFLVFKRLASKIISCFILMIFVASCCYLYYLQEKRVTRIQDCFDTLDEKVFYKEPQRFLKELDKILSQPCPAYYKANCFYNRAIILNSLNRKQEAIYSLYVALKLVPLHTVAQEALRVISLTLGNEEIINFHGLVWVNWLFGGILLGYNLFFLFFLLFLKDRVKRFFSSLIILLLVLIQVFFIFSWLKNIHKPLGILKGSFVPICKVPDLYTRFWLFARGGLAVYILEETSYFYRIKLPSGTQGWVQKDYMSEVP